MRLNNQILLNGLNYLNINYPFYYEILMQTKFKIDNSIPSMGIYVDTLGINIIYNEKFVSHFNKNNCITVLIHEVLHVLNNHAERTGERNRELSNISQDMVINDIIINNIEEHDFNISNFKPCLLPKEYTGEKIFENVYNYLQSEIDNKTEYGKNLKKMINDSKNNPMGNQTTIDVHIDDKCSEDMKKSIVNEIIIGMRARGLLHGNYESILGLLNKPKKDYLKKIKQKFESLIGTKKHYTYMREHRQEIFGLKGYKKTGIKLNIILDVSGSMSNEFTKVLSYINQKNIEFNLIQCDTEITAINKFKDNKKLNKIKIKGLGGTILQPAVDMVAKQFNQFNTVILTDGYTDTLNFANIKGNVLVITTDKKIEFLNGEKVEQIVVVK